MRVLSDLNPTPATQEIVYNALDTLNTFRLKQTFDKIIPPWGVYAFRYSEKMLGPIFTMMRRGFRIDLSARDQLIEQLKHRYKSVSEKFDFICQELIGTTINPNSVQQLRSLFFEFLAIPETYRYVKGETKLSVDRRTLEKLAKEYVRAIPFANLLMRISDLEKQIEFLSKSLSADGRFHASYNLAGTETFRLSSSEHPLRIGGNIQNIPPLARYVFVPDPGYTLFQADQQGAEARIVAYLSGDEAYIQACESGDAHTLVASMVFGFEPRRDLAEREYYRGKSYRQVAKSGSHGSNYKGKPFTLAQQMGVTVEIAEQFQTRYFRAFPGIVEWHSAVARKLQNDGSIVTPFGLTRTFWGRRFDDATLREAIAFVPQSTVATITNVGLYKLWYYFEGVKNPDAMILANGHDAVIGQVRTDRLEPTLQKILDLLRVPFYVTDIRGTTRECVIPFSVEIGQNWAKADETNPNGLKKWAPPNDAA